MYLKYGFRHHKYLYRYDGGKRRGYFGLLSFIIADFSRLKLNPSSGVFGSYFITWCQCCWWWWWLSWCLKYKKKAEKKIHFSWVLLIERLLLIYTWHCVYIIHICMYLYKLYNERKKIEGNSFRFYVQINLATMSIATLSQPCQLFVHFIWKWKTLPLRTKRIWE